jgi:CRP-like cAMP-binding protein
LGTESGCFYNQGEKFMMTGVDLLPTTTLFAGLSVPECQQVLQCLGASQKKYAKNTFIYRGGEQAVQLGLVLAGSVQVLRDDYWGNENIVTVLETGDTFAESYACVPTLALAVSVQARTPATILFLNLQRLLTPCGQNCPFHQQLIQNLVGLVAAKNVFLQEKLSYLTQRTTRQKLLAYLSAVSLRQKSPQFTIPLNRQQLADFLSVDRSALSNELSKLRREGVLEFTKNKFVFTKPR